MEDCVLLPIDMAFLNNSSEQNVNLRYYFAIYLSNYTNGNYKKTHYCDTTNKTSLKNKIKK